LPACGLLTEQTAHAGAALQDEYDVSHMTSINEEKALEILSGAGQPLAPYISVSPEGIVIASGYSEALVRLLRWVPKAIWRPDKRAWLVPLAGADALRSVLPEILRLAEAATEERREERALAQNAEAALGRERLAALINAVAHASEEIKAMTQSAPPPDMARDDLASLIATLRAEAAKLGEAVDRLDAWHIDAARKMPR